MVVRIVTHQFFLRLLPLVPYPYSLVPRAGDVLALLGYVNDVTHRVGVADVRLYKMELLTFEHSVNIVIHIVIWSRNRGNMSASLQLVLHFESFI